MADEDSQTRNNSLDQCNKDSCLHREVYPANYGIESDIAWDPLDLRPEFYRRAAEVKLGQCLVLLKMDKTVSGAKEGRSRSNTNSEGETHTGSNGSDNGFSDTEPDVEPDVSDLLNLKGATYDEDEPLEDGVTLSPVTAEASDAEAGDAEQEDEEETAKEVHHRKAATVSEAQDAIEGDHEQPEEAVAELVQEQANETADETIGDGCDGFCKFDTRPGDDEADDEEYEVEDDKQDEEEIEEESEEGAHEEDDGAHLAVFPEDCGKSVASTLDADAAPFVPPSMVRQTTAERMRWSEEPDELEDMVPTPGQTSLPSARQRGQHAAAGFGKQPKPLRPQGLRRHTAFPIPVPVPVIPLVPSTYWMGPPPQMADYASMHLAVSMHPGSGYGMFMWPTDAMAVGPPEDAQSKAKRRSLGGGASAIANEGSTAAAGSSADCWLAKHASQTDARPPQNWAPEGSNSPLHKLKGSGQAKPISFTATSSSSTRHLTLGEIMRNLQTAETSQVVVVRKIKHLGFNSVKALRNHFSIFGAVDRVLVSHSHVQDRVRPACLGFVVMSTAEATKEALAAGSTQVVDGVTICVGPFQRKTF